MIFLTKNFKKKFMFQTSVILTLSQLQVKLRICPRSGRFLHRIQIRNSKSRTIHVKIKYLENGSRCRETSYTIEKRMKSSVESGKLHENPMGEGPKNVKNVTSIVSWFSSWGRSIFARWQQPILYRVYLFMFYLFFHHFHINIRFH